VLPQQRLKTLIEGPVFHDDPSVGLEIVRTKLKYYPNEVWLYGFHALFFISENVLSVCVIQLVLGISSLLNGKGSVKKNRLYLGMATSAQNLGVHSLLPDKFMKLCA
jgi:hypothetical protein